MERGTLVIHPFVADAVGVVLAITVEGVWARFTGIEPGDQIGPASKFEVATEERVRSWLSQALLSKVARELKP